MTKNLKLLGLPFALLLLVSVHPARTEADAFPPNSPTCATVAVNQSVSFSVVGSAPLYSTYEYGSELAFWDGSNWQATHSSQPDPAGRNWSGSFSWSTPGTYAARALGPVSMTSTCNASGCSSNGGPSGATLYGPSGSSSGGPAFCKIVVTATVPPTAPASESYSCVASGQSVTMSWPSGANDTSYLHKLFNIDSGSSLVSSGEVTGLSTSYSISPGIQYQGSVAGKNASGSSGQTYSSTYVCRLPPPTGLSASCGGAGTTASLSWSGVSGATSYYVRATDLTTGTTALWDDNHSGTSDSFTSIPGHTYQWWVHSDMGHGDGNTNHYSDQANGTNFTCASATPVNGSCGTANGGSYTSAPTSGLCSAGTASGVSGSGPWTWSCTGTNGGSTASCSASKSATGQPNLTAGSVSPTSVTSGVSTSFSSTITNSGSASTGAAFYVLFQSATNASGAGAADLGSVQTTALAGSNAQRAVSKTFSFTSATYMRACADKSSSSDTGSITESNESDNCSAWTLISMAATPTLSCIVTPTSVTTLPGTVTYTASGASAPYTWNDSVGGSYGTTASVARTISAAGSYAMTVSKSGYTSGTCPTVTGGNFCSGGNATLSITATPNRVHAGSSSLIAWSATNVQGPSPTCTVTRSDSSTDIQDPTAGPAPTCAITNSSSNQTVTSQTVFTITCGSDSKSVIVNVIPNFVEF